MSKPTEINRVREALDQMESTLEKHPEIRERTAAYLAGELQAEEDMPEMTTVKLPKELVKRADKLISFLQQTDVGHAVKVTRSVVIRVALGKGFELLEQEAAEAKKTRKRK